MNDNTKKQTFNLQPNFKGKLIELRPLRSEDFEELYAVASDPLIWEQHPARYRYQREIFQKFFDEAILSQGALAILDAKSSEMIGSSRYYDLSAEKSEIVIGYTFLARAYWGGTTNRELKTLMLNHIFQFVDNVLFHVGATNRRSQKAMDKTGAQLLEKKYKLECGEQHEDYYIYRIERLKWSGSGDHRPV